MLSSESDILSEIDSTIDQLLENANALSKINGKKDFEEEKIALENMQESLLAHLIHMDELLKQKQPQHLEPLQPSVKPLLTTSLHNKLGRAGYLNQLMKKNSEPSSDFSDPKCKKPKIHKKKMFALKLVSR